MADYPFRVTRCDDGVYRWSYDMDMYQNNSILYTLEKINLITFLGVSLGGALLMGIMERDFGAPIVRGFLLIGLGMGALMAILYVVGFYVAAWIKGGHYLMRFDMREDGIELVWSEPLKEGFRTGRKAMVLAGLAFGSRRLRGRYRPTLDEVSRLSFDAVLRVKRDPKWNMIDLSVPGGKFQVYAIGEDLDFVESFILERVPEHARRA